MEFLERSFVLVIIVSTLLGSSLVFLTTVAQASDVCPDQIDGKTKEQLTADLEACNKEIAQWTSALSSTKQESASFTRDVKALTAKINAAQSSIKAKNIAMVNLGKNITEKQNQIDNLDTQIGRGHQALNSFKKNKRNRLIYNRRSCAIK